jgi:hypothetical protein
MHEVLKGRDMAEHLAADPSVIGPMRVAALKQRQTSGNPIRDALRG